MTTTDTTTLPAGVTPDGVADATQDDMFAAIGIRTKRKVNRKTVDIPPLVRKFIAGELSWFTTEPNTTKQELYLDTEAQADLFRAQLVSYASEYNLNLTLPDENEFGDKLNAGTRVTYRLTVKSAKDESAEDTKTVTSTVDLTKVKSAGK